MCGLLGLMGGAESSPQSRLHRVGLGLAALAHRGPDDRGVDVFHCGERSLVLGHTRLSIIDLSSAGHQPMRSGDGRWTIVFNGEIYNYRELRESLASSGYIFRTDSDTEVLLAAWSCWGVACLSRLIGMFAFAVYDRDAGVLTLARDAFGIKPLFYARHELLGSWAFASEIPALLPLLSRGPALNLQSAADYLLLGSYDGQASTFYEGISHLPAGHWINVSLEDGRCSDPVRWWNPSVSVRHGLSLEAAAEELRERFLETVRLHLRTDVPLGAALSGGVDSSAVVCAMRYVEPHLPIHTFTFVTPGWAGNEQPWADLVNAHVGAIPHRIQAGSEGLVDGLDTLIRAQGEPFASTSIFAQFRVFQAAREAGITVTLDGQGADELLAGYEGYPQARVRSLLDQHRYGDACQFLQAWRRWPSRGSRRALQALALALAPEPEQTGRRLRRLRASLRGACVDSRWLRDRGVIAGASPLPPPFPDADQQGRQLVAALRSAMTGTGLAALLRHGDRNSMHWSVESRVPFLTPDLAEFVLSLPEEYLLSAEGETKHVFRRAMRGIVPDAILDRRDKIGFATPEQAWLRDLSPRIDEWLAVADDIPFLRRSECVALVRATLAGRRPFTWQAWRLINFCRWMHLFQPVVHA
ncbi:MAG: asparagine synthase (glutamine-hydrolyzing) [Cyanobium sp.]